MEPMIEIEHPDVKPTSMVPASSLPVWEREGWKRVKARKAASDKARKAANDKEQ